MKTVVPACKKLSFFNYKSLQIQKFLDLKKCV